MEERYGLPDLRARLEDVLELVDDHWHTGQGYEEEPAKGYQCRKCGGRVFNVGKSDYWTGVRCVACQYEVCVHSG